MKTLKKLIFYTMLSIFFAASSLPSYASQTEKFYNDGEGIVTKIAVPNENGELIIYTGEEARKMYENLDEYIENVSCRNCEEFYSKVSEVSIDSDEVVDEEVIEDMDVTDDTMPVNPYHYRYRYVEKQTTKKRGRKKAVSQPLINLTSITQSMNTTVSHTERAYLSGNLTGKFKEVVEATLNAGVDKSVSVSISLPVNVAPHTKTQLFFIPTYRYRTGEAQKYYVPRRPIHPQRKKPVIVERRNVEYIEPIEVYVDFHNTRFKSPLGTYVWMEKRA